MPFFITIAHMPANVSTLKSPLSSSSGHRLGTVVLHSTRRYPLPRLLKRADSLWPLFHQEWALRGSFRKLRSGKPEIAIFGFGRLGIRRHLPPPIPTSAAASPPWKFLC